MGGQLWLHARAPSGLQACCALRQGFVLEYMLSFDNLFVFHLIFSYYCTPEETRSIMNEIQNGQNMPKP